MIFTRSLRAKLFLSMGIVLLLVAALGYFVPETLVKRDIDRASHYLSHQIEEAQHKLIKTLSFVITSHLLENAVELQGATEMIQALRRSAGDVSHFAQRVASYSPEVAFVEMSDAQGKIVIAPADATLYQPQWAQAGETLWIYLPEKGEFYQAQALPASTSKSSLSSYLLLSADPKEAPSHFTSMKERELLFSPSFTSTELYQFLLQEEKRWLQKIALMHQLSAWREEKRVKGILALSENFQEGYCLRKAEIFPTHSLTSQLTLNKLQLLPRNTSSGQELDIVTLISLEKGETLGLGLSISNQAQRIAQLTGNRVILFQKGAFALGINPDGTTFAAEAIASQLEERAKIVEWQGASYTPFTLDLTSLTLAVLSPENESQALMRFLARLRSSLIEKISLNLLITGLLSFLLALFLLHRISRKITQPITQLARASSAIGEGEYKNLELPAVENRDDEVATLTHSFGKMVLALQDREKIRGVLNKVVSKDVAEEILKSNIELGGEERIVTMLFSDIRGFTRFSESLEPKQLIAILNEYMTKMCSIIDATQGVVDKFVGDEIMALYGAPLSLKDSALHAIESAVRMREALHHWNRERESHGEATFGSGIGIHTGLVCCGNMGAANRLNYTVIGAPVNLAARICTQAAPMQILISEETYHSTQVQEHFVCQSLQPILLKGIEQPVILYEIVSRA